MMGLFRNKEVKKAFAVYLTVGVLFICAAFFINILCGVLMLCALFMLLLIWLFETGKRYSRISELSRDVNKILHGDDSVRLEKYAEGELAILQSEIYKMTVRLREQRLRLTDDKIYLSNSLADISHQIKTPLTTVNLLVSLLSEPGLTDDKRSELCLELFEMLSRIDWLITALLKISKLDAKTVKFVYENVSIQTLIKKAAEPLSVPMDIKEQRMTVRCTGNVCCDVSWCAEALGNIIKNCIEHTPQGGVIEITGEENALYSQIVIKDSGEGIEPGELHKIFDRFYKGKNSDSKSFGIGLALARMIVSGNNGTVKADNASEGGAAFTVRIYKSIV